MALSGDHVIVKMDDSNGTLRQFADGDISSIDLGMTFAQHDVSGFGQAAQNFINGQLQAPVTIKGYLTTDGSNGTHTLLNGAFQAGEMVDLEVQVGNNATPGSGDPKYAGTFYVESYKPSLANGSAVTFEASLKPATGAAPVWGTV